MQRGHYPNPNHTIPKEALGQGIHFYVDGGVFGHNPSPRGVYWSVYLDHPRENPRGVVIHKAESREHHTNNEAEWLAVGAALQYAQEHFPREHLVIFSDSRLIVLQYIGRYQNKIARLHRMMTEVQLQAATFPSVRLFWKSRWEMVRRLGH